MPPKHYPSLLWEISGNGLNKPSYLFGTMHVSSKMVFHLSDSFYLGIKNADVVALETNMGSWQEDFSRYDLDGQAMYGYYSGLKGPIGSPTDYLTIHTLRYFPYEKMIEAALHNSPSVINNFLYRSYSERASDFEEDTYLDLHIYQAGKKWGKKVCGVEDFDESMKLMKEAYEDASREKEKKERSYDYDGDFSYAKMEDAYRTGNLDLLDTINKVNSQSAAFDEKFLYKRNEIQANSIDSILKTKQRLFVGVGAAHLPGQRGVIEMLRRMGYKLRPIKMTERDSRHKDEVEKIRVPVQFSSQTSEDGFFSVDVPGKLYDFNSSNGLARQQQFADMSNGSYYMVTRIHTNSLLWGHSEEVLMRKIDSVLYENVPGKILTKQKITRNGYKGIEVVNRTRRGDYQRYNIFVTPFEIIVFKMSGNGEYVQEGTEGNRFFSSIQFKEYKPEWKKWSPTFGGFEVDFPHQPVISNADSWQFMAMDANSKTGYEVIRTDIHNYDFVEEDSFDLGLMEESFASSEFVDKKLSRKQGRNGNHSTLDVKYRYKDGSVALVRFLIQGPHYYTVVAHGKSETPRMKQFIQSFTIKPFVYGEPVQQSDTSLYFTVSTPVPLDKEKKISMYPENIYGNYGNDDEDLVFIERGMQKDKLVSSDSTGEKIYISFTKPSRYYFDEDTVVTHDDTTHFKTNKIDWIYRSRKKYELPNKTKVLEYELGDPASSRYLRGKLFTRDGVGYRLETLCDTATQPSEFINTFFTSFSPSDTVKGTNPREKKTPLFFSDFFSADSLLHKRAVKNVNMLQFDSVDFPQLKKAIASLTWKEKKYMDVKNDFVWQLSSIKTKESSDYLKEIYFAAGDTVELQYTALEALLYQQTGYAYSVFRDIMTTEPPVLELGTGSNSGSSRRSIRTWPVSQGTYDIVSTYDYDYGGNRTFFQGLNDTLELTRAIFNDLLPLININDYEQPIMDLMGTLIDSNLLVARDYEMYLPKFMIEAKQLLKKQVIKEKNRSIEKAQEDEDDRNNRYNNSNQDYGNSQLSLYATLLMPFWDQNPAVPQLVNQMLKSEDKMLKYNTTMMLLRYQKPVPDTLLKYFAGLDDYSYDLYTDLKKIKKANLFPSSVTHVDLARSRLLSMTSSYNKPDTIAFIDKLPVQHKERSGFVYFFKYKLKKDDNSWKLASVGIVPADPKQFQFEKKKNYYEELQYDFTEMDAGKIEIDEPLKDQLAKTLKKMLYSKRNSATEFYKYEDRGPYDYMESLGIRD
ncbi:MAG TPA: TraB/GumN family protein [Flavisolibacter sp.]